MMDLLEKVKHFIEEENYNALEAICNVKLAKLGKCRGVEMILKVGGGGAN